MLYGQRNLILADVERDAMRRAGRFNAQVMDHIRPFVQPGITTAELDRRIHDFTRSRGHDLACLGYQGFPKSCCISINEVVCHGIPSNYELKSGDIVNIDITSIVDGWFGDQSETFLVGDVSDEAIRVTQTAFDCLYLGIDAIAPGGRVADIGRAIVKHAQECGYSVVREYVGHGIGRHFHQDPSIPHYPNRQSLSDIIEPGMCFTVEPMINAGTRHTVLDRRDGWTVRTRDGKLSAQFEHTILMTETGPEILTLTQDGPQRGHGFGRS
jgi:methionyl aminopeptidase